LVKNGTLDSELPCLESRPLKNKEKTLAKYTALSATLELNNYVKIIIGGWVVDFF